MYFINRGFDKLFVFLQKLVMDLFKSKSDVLRSKIVEKNLLLMNECDSEYELQKLYYWQEDYDWVDWEEFKNSWFYCSRCKGYSKGQCICYAR